MLLILLVLYSAKSRKWKVSDFGLTMEGHSRLEQTTSYGRGTSGYRAPELLLVGSWRRGGSEGAEDPRFSKKSDMWAMGCMFYELIFAHQLFLSDMSARDYAVSGAILQIPPQLTIIAPYSGPVVSRQLTSMLNPDPSMRPSAGNLLGPFTVCFQLSSIISEFDTPECPYSLDGEYKVGSLLHVWFERVLAGFTFECPKEGGLYSPEIVRITTALAPLCTWLRLPMFGLTVGHLYFDLYLLETKLEILFSDSSTTVGSWNRVYELIVIDICVGRRQQDIEHLSKVYQRRHPAGPSLFETLQQKVTSVVLQYALEVIFSVQSLID